MSDTESESGSSSGSSEGEEPLFKYSRITKFPRTFFGKDPVSAALVGNILAVGTHSGVLHLAEPNLEPIRTTRIHRASVSSIDTDGHYIATASIDGTIVISSISDPQDVQAINVMRPVRAIALDPNYSQTKTFVSGGTSGAVTLTSRGWIKSRSETVLEQSNGSILAIAWKDTSIIWCSDDGITIYDTVTSSIVSNIPHELQQADLYKPSIKVTDTLALVAWGQTIWLLDLVDAKILRKIHVDWTLAGICPFDDTHFLLLCVDMNQPPELRVVDLDGSETYVDEVTMQGYQRLSSLDYHLKADDGHWYIFSATDAVTAKLRDAKDHIDWLMDEGQFDEAYNQSVGVLSTTERQELGLKAVEILLENDRWSEAAEVLAQCLGSDDWSEWIERFSASNHQIELGKVLPQSNLGSAHTDILVWCLDNDKREALQEFLLTWDINRFEKSKIIRKLEKKKTKEYRNLLAQLYLRLGEPYNAVKCYLWSKDKRSFNVVVKYHLWNSMLSDLEEILTCDVGDGIKERISELVNSRLELGPPKVVAQLKDSHLIFLYLQQLSQEDEFLVKDFGDLMVKLYAKHDRERLLSFLMLNGTYNLNAAIEICQANNFTDELIYLYGQVGKTHEALDLIINQLEDAKLAVQFAVEHKDDDLWDYLITYSKDKPEFVIELLRCPQVAPARVLEAVPHTLKIPGLRTALYDVLMGQKAVLFLNEGVLQIVKAEAKEHLVTLQRARKEGHPVDSDNDDVDWSVPVLLTSNGPQVVPIYGKASGSWLSRKISHLGEALRYVHATY